MKIQKRTIALCIYFGFLILPIYWMLNMSLRTNADILANFALYPADATFKNYIRIFTDPTWYNAYINAMIYDIKSDLDVEFIGTRVVTNDAGHRGPTIAREKKKGAFRIVGIGDSVMWGWGVKDEERYLDVLRDLLDAGAIEEVELSLRRTPRNADELHDLLRRAGPHRGGLPGSGACGVFSWLLFGSPVLACSLVSRG